MKIEFDGELNMMDVDGVSISLEVLKRLSNPDANFFYQFERSGDLVIVRRFDPRGQELLDAINEAAYALVAHG
jgi:hypothetical protein